MAGVSEPSATDAAAVDHGQVPPAVLAALTAYAAHEGSLASVLLALQDGRLLVPMVEVPDGTFTDHEHDDHDDHDHDHPPGAHHRGPQLAAVSLQRPDGRRGLLAFTGTEPLARWNPDARPLPLATRRAAETAVRDGAAALVIDVAGPVQVVVQGAELAALAQGWTLGRIGDRAGWVPTGVPGAEAPTATIGRPPE